MGIALRKGEAAVSGTVVGKIEGKECMITGEFKRDSVCVCVCVCVCVRVCVSVRFVVVVAMCIL
jgi:hypothetical protein